MKKTLAVAEFTVRKIEEPAFLILLAFGLACGYVVSEMEPFTLGKEYLQIGVFGGGGEALPLLGGFVALITITLLLSGFYGATDIPREIESGTIMIILGKPVSRTEYMLGKYLGVVCISLLFYFVSSLSLMAGHLIKTGKIFPLELLLRQMILILVIFPFTAINMAFSCFLHDLSAMIVASIYITFSLATGLIPIAVNLIPKSAWIDVWLYLLYYMFPNFFFFLLPVRIPGLVFVSMILYAAGISFCFIFIGSLGIESKDMN